jgi:hypothetical protein
MLLKESLFDLPEKPDNEEKIKQWEKWEMHENFIRMLYAMDTDKIYKFKVVYRKGVRYYSIKQGERYSVKQRAGEKTVTENDLEFIKNYFESEGWKVDESYFQKISSNSFELYKSLKNLYIRGIK